MKMILRIGTSLEINAYVDASFGIYDDMKSLTGAKAKDVVLEFRCKVHGQTSQ
jgi:hypothetical protein